ncbi:hypothetical protein [Pseudomonas alloputida]|uniref:hypothetical protein n=1 Tax=Pseudomonas alloputida TaxID=1940621 RepID=UPI00386F7B8C
MRVPLTPFDFEAKRGFKRIAKLIQREWQGSEPICLGHAQILLAQCFGYIDYHDATKSTEYPLSASALPALQDVWSNSLYLIQSHLAKTSSAQAINLTDLIKAIKAWPFLTLTAYRQHYGNVDYHALVKEVEHAWHTETFAYIDSLK